MWSLNQWISPVSVINRMIGTNPNLPKNLCEKIDDVMKKNEVLWLSLYSSFEQHESCPWNGPELDRRDLQGTSSGNMLPSHASLNPDSVHLSEMCSSFGLKRESLRDYFGESAHTWGRTVPMASLLDPVGLLLDTSPFFSRLLENTERVKIHSGQFFAIGSTNSSLDSALSEAASTSRAILVFFNCCKRFCSISSSQRLHRVELPCLFPSARELDSAATRAIHLLQKFLRVFL